MSTAMPEQALATALARQVRQLALRAAAAPAAAEAAAAATQALVLAQAGGAVFLRLAALPAAPELPSGAAAWREALAASGVTGTGAPPAVLPLVLDAADRLWLHRHFDHHRRLQARLASAARGVIPAAPAEAAPAAVLDWQQVAVALALRGRFTVISGGPGTGKTSTVAALLAAVLAERPDTIVALAAPTGRAAARLIAAVRARATAWPPAMQSGLPESATTVHRLLGIHPATGQPSFHAGRRLGIDLLVVDEASMLDLALARQLFDAVPEGARIVLLGDKDQLGPVAPGAVFAELAADPTLSPACVQDIAARTGIAAAEIVPPPAAEVGLGRPDTTVWLRRTWRFDAGSAIGALTALVKAGDAAALHAWLAARRDGNGGVRWIDDGGAEPEPGTWELIDAGYAPYLDVLRQTPGDAAAVLAAFDAFRVLCALRDGPRGVAGINEVLDRRLRQSAADPWYAGRPVMVLHNDGLLGLANGDVGIALPDAGGALVVHFAGAEPGRTLAVPRLRLPAHETAFATTVHKAQGSEVEQGLLLLPPTTRPTGISRRLLYTAVTRFRSGIAIAASGPTLAIAMEADAPPAAAAG